MAAVEWISEYGDKDNDAFVEYERKNPKERAIIHKIGIPKRKPVLSEKRFVNGTLNEIPKAIATTVKNHNLRKNSALNLLNKINKKIAIMKAKIIEVKALAKSAFSFGSGTSRPNGKPGESTLTTFPSIIFTEE